MSGTLRDLMAERAQAAPPPRVDLGTVVESGNARLRRRRTALGAGVAGVVLAAALAAPALAPDESDGGPGQLQPAAPAFADRQVTYALGSKIFYGNQQLDVSPYDVSTFVQTDDGFVFTDKAGNVIFTDGTATDVIGATDQPYGRLLAADDSGSYVAWVDTNARPAPQFVVYDTAARRTVVLTADGNTPDAMSAGEFDIPMVRAVDGDHAYWHSSKGISAFDLRAGTGSLLAPGANYLRLQDVAAGTLAETSPDTQRTVISSGPGTPEQTFAGEGANVSPEARYVATQLNDEQKVFDVATGADVSPAHAGYPFIGLTQWTSDNTFVALGIPAGNTESDPLDLLTCSIPTQQCAVAVPHVGRIGELALPNGERIGD
jgi:hypothetical protein